MQRRHALMNGLFKVMDVQSGKMLEDTEDFREAVNDHQKRGRMKTFPGSGDRHHIVWLDEVSEIHVDRLVKLYDFEAVRLHKRDQLSEGPASPWFGLVDPRQTPTFDGAVHFDANLFWTVALLYKCFGSCGVWQWDVEISAMAEVKKDENVRSNESK